MAAINVSILFQHRYLKKYYIYCSETNFACKINAIPPMQPTEINNIMQRIIFMQAIISISSHKCPQRQFEAVTVTKIINISHLF